ncbi:hypothetical protein TthWC1_2369 [Thermoanaerobacter thermohydrosulfuricus WC1]|uniref:Uncharacterized protein n=1 Tax=Thermoanaerobacter thermohydrosulfuricus WC1 TaxID=1198630 RepID=M8CUP5_THETY|nr:hypothetical protein [Thermoanaerobacter thermohydrosulfuricus]EMT38149.1 hypothetical protein TthWC1_2369 [Thermoanaerobacter thermohydrosulfuricus WC1]
MRSTIRQLLIDGVPQVQGRVYEPHAAGATTQKPYLVLKEGVQDPESDWAAFSTVIEVWPYVNRTTFQQVDAIANAVINALHRARFSEAGEQYLGDYIGTASQDFVDDEWDAITKGLRFRIFALGWLNCLTYDPDPVVVLQSWAKATWPEVHTDPATWSPADTAPGIYWRLVRIAPAQITAAVNWVEVQLAGHVLAPSPAVRLTWVRKLTEGLAKQRRLKMSDGGPLELLKVAADSEADPMRRGQIQLTARFGVLQPTAQALVLGKAVVSGAVSGEVT